MSVKQVLALVLTCIAVVSVASVCDARSFTCDDIAIWPRTYPHYGEEVKQYWPRAASNGDSFLVAWYERFYYSASIVGTAAYAARFSSSGELLDPDGIVVAADTYAYHSRQEPALCVVGDDYWVFHGSYGLVEDIYATPVSADGTVGDDIFVGSAYSMASITSLAADYMEGGNVMAAWHKVDPDGIYYSLLEPVTPTQAIDSQLVLLDDHLYDHVAVSASEDCGKFLVAYYRSYTDGDWLGAVRVDGDGQVLDDPPIIVAEYMSYVASGVFDVVPYTLDDQHGWVVMYDRGWTTGLLCGRFVADDGTVSDELFAIENPTSKHWGDCTLWAREAEFGLQLAWSSYDWIFYPDIVQYGTVYNLDSSFEVITQDVLPGEHTGSQLCLAANDVGTTVAVWSVGLEWTWPDFPKRKLMGGLYVSHPPQTWFEDDDLGITYSGTWSQLAHAAASGGHVGYSKETGATAELVFYGTGARWALAMGPMMGKANVYLDDGYIGQLDLFRWSPRLITVGRGGLAPGLHTLTIEVSGEKNPSSWGYFVDLDAFEVVP